MLFNSYLFIFLFLPLVLLGYYLLGSRGHFRAAVYFLTAMSLGFYGYNSISALLILFVSMWSIMTLAASCRRQSGQ